jgi:hypothetical protein
MAMARATMMSVPTMALPMPLPGIPSGVGVWTRNPPDSAGSPRETMYATSAIRGTSETHSAATHSVVAIRPNRRRRAMWRRVPARTRSRRTEATDGPVASTVSADSVMGLAPLR